MEKEIEKSEEIKSDPKITAKSTPIEFIRAGEQLMLKKQLENCSKKFPPPKEWYDEEIEWQELCNSDDPTYEELKELAEHFTKIQEENHDIRKNP